MSLDDVDALDELHGLSEYETDDGAIGGDYRVSKPRKKATPIATPTDDKKKRQKVAMTALGIGAGLLAVGYAAKTGKLTTLGKKLRFWDSSTAAKLPEKTNDVVMATDVWKSSGYAAKNMLTFANFTENLQNPDYRVEVTKKINAIFQAKFEKICKQLQSDLDELKKLASSAQVVEEFGEKTGEVTNLCSHIAPEAAVAIKQRKEYFAKDTQDDAAENDAAADDKRKTMTMSSTGDRAQSTEMVDYNDQKIYFKKRMAVANSLKNFISADNKLIADRVKDLAEFCKGNLPNSTAQAALWDSLTASVLTMWEEPGNETSAHIGFSNIALFGRSGVGKSTVAKSIAEFMRLAGIVTGFGGELRPTRASELLNSHLGMSERQVRRALYQNYEDVMFIDEAQGLASGGGNKKVAQGVVNWLTEWLGEHPREIVLIIAGYGEDIRNEVFKLNYGLARRFSLHITIRPHGPGALLEMYANGLQDRKIQVRQMLIETLKSTMRLDFLFPKSAASVQDLLSATSTAILNDRVTSKRKENILTLRIFWDALHRYTKANNVQGSELLDGTSDSIILPGSVDKVFSEREDAETDAQLSKRLKTQSESWKRDITELLSVARRRVDYFVDQKPFFQEIDINHLQNAGLPKETEDFIIKSDLIEKQLSNNLTFTSLEEYSITSNRNRIIIIEGEKSPTNIPAPLKAPSHDTNNSGDLFDDSDEGKIEDAESQDKKSKDNALLILQNMVADPREYQSYIRIEYVRSKGITNYSQHLIEESNEAMIMTPLQTLGLKTTK